MYDMIATEADDHISLRQLVSTKSDVLCGIHDIYGVFEG